MQHTEHDKIVLDAFEEAYPEATDSGGALGIVDNISDGSVWSKIKRHLRATLYLVRGGTYLRVAINCNYILTPYLPILAVRLMPEVRQAHCGGFMNCSTSN